MPHCNVKQFNFVINVNLSQNFQPLPAGPIDRNLSGT